MPTPQTVPGIYDESPGETPILQLSDVSVLHKARGGSALSRDRVHALTEATISIGRGETVGVVGESGCGKSTMAKVMVGLQQPSAGTIRYSGEDVWKMSAGRRRRTVGAQVGMIFQDASTALNRRMPIRQVLRDPLDVHRQGTVKERIGRVRELMELVGLPPSVADVLPSQLSGGQRQRVAIARALALGPSLVVADEPTSALDVSVRAQILNLLLELKETLDLALVFVSHDIQTVKRMSDRVVTMYLGRIVESTPADLLPLGARHPYTRALFSATPSLLDATDPIPLDGAVPSAVHPPSGCPFRTRCWRATAQCAGEMPPLTTDTGTPDGSHEFRCYHPIAAGTSDAELIAEAARARSAGAGPAAGDGAPARTLAP